MWRGRWTSEGKCLWGHLEQLRFNFKSVTNGSKWIFWGFLKEDLAACPPLITLISVSVSVPFPQLPHSPVGLFFSISESWFYALNRGRWFLTSPTQGRCLWCCSCFKALFNISLMPDRMVCCVRSLTVTCKALVWNRICEYQNVSFKRTLGFPTSGL